VSKLPVKRAASIPVEVDADNVEVIAPLARGGAWFSFSYSHTEVSVVGGAARVKTRRASFRDGKLNTESFEGEIDRSVYERMVDDAQRFFLAQTALLARTLGAFLPRDRERD
jgi:hypothetical protein